jgi:hypothetical protein
MYTGTNQGLSQAWDRYVEHLRNFSEGAENLDSPETSSPLLPSTLDLNSGFVTHKFASSTTSPAVIFSFDRHTAYELLLSLAVSLRRGFSISANPEVILARELAAAGESAKEPGKVKTIILAGASNLGSLKPIFQAHGATVIDLTKPGWMITEKNLESLKNELSALSHMEDTAVIFDIFGNSAYKFKHVDGTLVLPFRVGGGTISWATSPWIRTVRSESSSARQNQFSAPLRTCSVSSCPPTLGTCSMAAARTAHIPQIWVRIAIHHRFWKPLCTFAKF